MPQASEPQPAKEAGIKRRRKDAGPPFTLGPKVGGPRARALFSSEQIGMQTLASSASHAGAAARSAARGGCPANHPPQPAHQHPEAGGEVMYLLSFPQLPLACLLYCKMRHALFMHNFAACYIMPLPQRPPWENIQKNAFPITPHAG